MVKAAYSSGKPAYGVGPGNVPALIDTSADVEDAVARVVEGKSFDYGTVCSSEQAIVAESGLRDRILNALKANGAFLANESQKEALAKLLITPNWTVNPLCVGQAPTKIARMAGFEVPPNTSIICVEVSGVGKEHPLSAEKLSPVLSLYFVADFAAALETCHALLRFGGTGHTAVIHAKNDARIREYGLRMPAYARAGEYAVAARLHRHHHQCFSGDDAGMRSGGGKRHVGQHRPAASVQHQAAGICSAQARRGVRNADRYRCRADRVGVRMRGAGGSRHGCRRGRTLSRRTRFHARSGNMAAPVSQLGGQRRGRSGRPIPRQEDQSRACRRRIRLTGVIRAARNGSSIRPLRPRRRR